MTNSYAEWCAECEGESPITGQFGIQKCAHCGADLVTCSLCPIDQPYEDIDCSKCPAKK